MFRLPGLRPYSFRTMHTYQEIGLKWDGLIREWGGEIARGIGRRVNRASPCQIKQGLIINYL
jgi:hypothetical protein